MRKTIFFIFIFVVIFSCSEDISRFNRRQNISKNKFVAILTEIHIMESIVGGYEYYKKYSGKDTVEIYGSILEKYGYTREEFDSTVSAYSRRPELYEKVYNEVLMKLNFMLDTLQKNNPQFERIPLND